MNQAALTVDSINSTLDAINMRPMEAGEFTQLLEAVPMQDLETAIKRAKNKDRDAIQYIRKQIARVFHGWSSGNAPQSPAAAHPAACNGAPQLQASASDKPRINTTAQGGQAVSRPGSDVIHQGGGQDNQTNIRQYYDHKAFGGKSVVGFYAKHDEKQQPSIYMEISNIIVVNSVRQGDWDNKLVLKITKQEMPVVMQVFLGYRAACQYDCHGPDKNKGFSIERQANNYFLKAWTKGAAHSLPISASDANYIFALFLKQWLELHPWMTDSGAMMQLRYICL